MSEAFDQPGQTRHNIPAMTPRGQEIAARLKEIFYAYTNRDTSDNRGAQAHLGPSEVGTPCDRRLAMSILRVPPVNPAGDGWAAFVGTAVHAALADMFVWAGHSSGRFAVELGLLFDSTVMPRGTGDLLDRTLCILADHKIMGDYSLKKLAQKGPSDTYRVQVNLYAHAARQMGEKVDTVAIIGWPRERPSLDDLYVWTEPFNGEVVDTALNRLAWLQEAVGLMSAEYPTALEAAAQFSTENDCRYCPFHAPGDNNMTRGCPGR